MIKLPPLLSMVLDNAYMIYQIRQGVNRQFHFCTLTVFCTPAWNHGKISGYGPEGKMDTVLNILLWLVILCAVAMMEGYIGYAAVRRETGKENYLVPLFIALFMAALIRVLFIVVDIFLRIPFWYILVSVIIAPAVMIYIYIDDEKKKFRTGSASSDPAGPEEKEYAPDRVNEY